jgi:hypothetical protein
MSQEPTRLIQTLTAMSALALVLQALSGPVHADACESLAPPSVTINRLEEPITLNTSYNYKSITVLGSSEHRPAKQVLGLTRGNATVKFTVQVSSIADHSGRWECSSPKIAVSFGYSPITVYVASEFAAGSCAYNEIYQHEMRHVKAYQAHLLGIEPDISETLKRRFATRAPWRGPVGQTRSMLEKEMHERWLPYIKREIERVEAAQALIDSPEEYARAGESCNGEIKRLIR